MPEIGLVAPTAAVARARRSQLSPRLADIRVVPLSLDAFLADAGAPGRIVLCPEGRNVARDLAFLRTVHERALWPPPDAELAGAIAGLRGSHDAVPHRVDSLPGRRGRQSALLLEHEVTLARARLAASSGAPRDWIVERAQSVRIGAAGLGELRRLGIRWSVLDPIEVIAVAASADLACAKARWSRWLPAETPLWVVSGRAES